ncbi:hypothetical protein C2G38_2149944 [Gigaspora rosea]|uniref:Uncharacterized protein n=1 Tax=Gigaspora rosea TaxID=44941 RepID=A0A397TYW1_9GLOM|nr:hypothetical protein C2G38_2149944 [Gigaspora rosea]
MTIDELYRKLLRIGRRANYRPEELRNKFLDALSILCLEKAKDISEHLPLDELAKKLYEIELRRIARHKRDRIPDLLVSQRASREIYEPLPVSAPQQQGISLEDMQKAIHNALAQQKTEYQSLLKKQKTDFQSQMAKQTQVPASQTVELVRQPRGPPPSLQTKEGMENFRLSQYLNNLGIFSREDFNRNYPIKPFQKPHQGRLYSSNQNVRMDRIESKVDEIGQMTSQFGKMMLDNKKPVAKSNSTYRYFPPLIPSQSQYASPDSDDNENEEDGYNEEENKWHAPSQSEKKNRASEFGGVNDATINALGWKADKPSDFAIKGNSKHIFESLGWYTDVPISVKDKDGMTWIRKVQGILDPNKNQFLMKLHGKTYTIPTFSKATERLIKTEEWLDMALNADVSNKVCAHCGSLNLFIEEASICIVFFW